MGKVKERQSDSWKPSMVLNTSGSISKNKKRKEKRLSKSLNTVGSNSDDSPLKKPSLGPLNKFKENLNLSLNIPSPGKKKDNKLLSTSLPIKGDKKSVISNLTPKKTNSKVTGILSVSNTPKKKGNKVTFNVDTKNENFIDSEAEEGEEPVTDKGAKPYEKGSQKKNLLKLKKMMQQNDSSGDESDDDVDSAEDFFDMEASEGEETDESDDMSDFLNDDDEDGSEAEDDDDDNEDEDNDASEDEDDTHRTDIKPLRRESVVLPLTKKEKKALVSTSKEIKREEKSQPANQKMKQKVVKVEKMETDQPVLENDVKPNLKKSAFVGFIRSLKFDVTEDQIKSTLSTKIVPQNIIEIAFIPNRQSEKKRNVLVYLKDIDSLDALLNHKFVVNEKVSFLVYKARETNKEKGRKFVAFLPRVPLTITEDQLKEVLGKEVGSENVLKFRTVKTFTKFNSRNILVYLSGLDSLEKLVKKGECKVGNEALVIRAAFEASVKIPSYKVFVSSVPEKTTEAVLKKAIESVTGKDSILGLRFSMGNSSFAFVSLANEEAQKKALEAGNNVSVKGTKINIAEFVPRKPSRKRGPPSAESKKKKNEAKKRKIENGGSTENSPNSKVKKNKHKKANGSASGGEESVATPKKVTSKDVLKKLTKIREEHEVTKTADGESASSPTAVKSKKNKNKRAKKAQQNASPVKAGENSSNAAKSKKKNKPPTNQTSPKPVVDAKKKALVAKMEAKKSNKLKVVKKEK